MPAMKIAQQIKKKIADEPSKLAVAMKWADDRTFGASDPLRLNSLYFMIYSDLNRMQMPTARMSNEAYRKYAWAAYMGLAAFEAMFMADLERCGNPAAKASVTALLSPRHEALILVNRMFPKEKIEAAWETALEFEAASGQRPGNADICSNNLSETEEEDQNALPATVKATYIGDAAWNAAREKSRQQLKVNWKQRYDAAMSVKEK
jgi:hypothetical protein